MKLTSLIKWFIPIVLILPFFVYFFLALNDQTANYKIEHEKTSLTPQATMKLKDVMYLKWDNDISNIPNEIPGGKLIQRKFNGRQMHMYLINELLTDINSNAKISFQRNENYSGQLVPHRWVTLKVNSPEELETKYDQIIKTFSSYGMKIMSLGKANYTDSAFHLEDTDGSGGISLDFWKDIKNMEIRIDVTRYEVITKQ